MLASRTSMRIGAGSKASPIARRPLVCKAADQEPSKAAPQTPEWVPEQAKPVLAFFESDNVALSNVQQNELYQKYLKTYVESPYMAQSTGFKKVPETINGRAAMIGFVAAAGAEVFGAGPVLGQLSQTPQPVLALLALITAASIIPIVKGTEGKYLDSLRDTYTLPEGVFTENMEKLHGRLAMVGLGGLIFFELVLGHALL